jgi:hypothetical protein
MDRRNLLKAFFALPAAAVAVPLAALAPKPFAAGGIVHNDTPYLVGQGFVGPLKGPSKNIGEVVVHIRCDTSQLEADIKSLIKGNEGKLLRQVRDAMRRYETDVSHKRLR